jgi:alpha-glucosidase
MDDANALIERAHHLGLKVILDMVPCHTSNEHPWFLESRTARNNPKADWYIWADAKPDGTPPNNWLSSFGGSGWEWEPRRAQYFFHSFLVSQPALNVNNPNVLAAILDVMRFWYDKGVDGFRLDAITAMAPDIDLRNNPPVPSYRPLPFVDLGTGNPFLKQIHLFDRDSENVLPILAQFRQLADRYDPPRFLFAEIGDVDGCAVGAKYAQSHLVHAAYIQDLLLLQPELTAEHAASVFRRQTEMAGDFWVFNAFSSHDIARHITRWERLAGKSADRKGLAKLLMGMLLTLRGCACLYQGEELGLPDVDLPYESIRDAAGRKFYPDYKGRDSCRTPMPWQANAPHAGFTRGTPWLPVDADHYALAVDVQEADSSSVLNAYRQFIQWRKKHEALAVGSMQVMEAPSPLFAFIRTLGHSRMLLVFNLSSSHAKWKPAGNWLADNEHGLSSATYTNGVLQFVGLDAFIAYGDT